MSNVAAAFGALTERPETVAVTKLDSLVKLPIAAANGMFRVTEKVQLAPGVSVPPVNVNRVSPADPVNDDPTPH